MRLARLDEFVENKKLASAIRSKDRKKLVNEGTILSARLIERLKTSGLNAVYIEADNFDIELQESIDNIKQAKIYTKLQEIFAKIEKNDFSNVDLTRFIRVEFLPEINNTPVSIPVDQVMDKEDTIQHSINVAMLAVRTATALGLSMDKIETTAFVALLHDIGKLIKNKDEFN